MASFKDLGLSDEILKAIGELGFETPSEIQEQAIPHLIEEETDFIGLAQTGTGKTAAFGLPLLQRIDPAHNATQALILAPTRELGKQIAEQLALFSKYQEKVNVLAVYGGAAIMNQIKALKKPQHVIIATPGRLIDLIKRKAVKLGHLELLVLDEADEMLNMGFKDELDEILSYASEDKLTWLFSATMSKEISRIVKTYMDDPLEVKVNTLNEVNANIEHQFTVVRQSDKAEALMRFLDVNPDMRGVVFCRTRRDTQNLSDYLLKRNYKADALHGDLSQQQRDRVMQRFKKHHLQVLIATDVAARGIDVNDLTHVFHHALPDDESYYTHRSGRTARAGKEGVSIAFVAGNEVHRINRLARQLDIEFQRVRVPSAEDIYDIRIENWCQEILTKQTKDKIDENLLDKVNILFGSLSKEELIEKILKHELESIVMDSSNDLNAEIERRGDRGGRGGRGRGGRGRGGRGHRGGGGGRRSGGGRGHRGGGSRRRRDGEGGGDRRGGYGDRRSGGGDRRKGGGSDRRKGGSGGEHRRTPTHKK